jgi:hypothetical protein
MKVAHDYKKDEKKLQEAFAKAWVEQRANAPLVKSTKWLTFTRQPNPGKKTHRYYVTNKVDQRLGWIEWKKEWRRYVFGIVSGGTILDSSCLGDIKQFLDELMEARKK